MSKHNDAAFTVALVGRTPTPRAIPRPTPIPIAAPAPSAPPAIKRPSRITIVGTLEVHVIIGHPVGVRHRIILDDVKAIQGLWKHVSVTFSTTACGQAIADRYYRIADEALIDGTMCPHCFTPLEVKRAAEIRDAQNQREQEAHDKFLAEREEHSRQLEASLRQRREENRRLKTGETAPISKVDPDTEDK